MIARVPASSANLGPGFDTLGMALSLYVEVGVVTGAVPDGARLIDRHHPASIAFVAGDGSGELWERCAIPSGRGLGFSGAVRVGGAALAFAQHRASTELTLDDRGALLAGVARLEGHADNVAASLFGGVVATARGRVVNVPLGFDPTIVVWIPSFATKTDDSRRSLGAPVKFDDVVFNLGQVATLVAALASGDVAAIGAAVDDRIHQPARLRHAEPSRRAMVAAREAGAWAAWLSGSGPTVAAMCSASDAESIAGMLPGDGDSKVLRIDHEGVTLEATSRS